MVEGEGLVGGAVHLWRAGLVTAGLAPPAVTAEAAEAGGWFF